MPHSLVGLVLVLLASVPQAAQAYGEGSESLPSWEERAVHLFTDRLRVEPGADDPEFSSYEAVRPLVYSAELNEAARFYAEDMAENGCFPEDHSSCDGTSFGARLAAFYPGEMIGENIALGSPTAELVVMNGWLYSPPHRDNMLSELWLELGTGHGPAETGGPYWVQDFGSRGTIDEPITTSAIHWPLRPAPDEEVSFLLAVYDPDSEPEHADFVVNGECRQLVQDRGTSSRGTYIGTTSIEASGCVPYYFVLTRADGSKVTYPSSGSLLMPVGGEECATWIESRDSLECNPEEDRPAFEASGSGCGTAALEGGGPDANLEESASYASCGTAGRGHPSLVWLLLLALQGLRRRQRCWSANEPAGPTISWPGS